MKTNYRKFLILLSGGLFAAGAAHGQSFLYDIDGVNGYTNLSGVGASGAVNFFQESGQWKSSVSVLNDSVIPSTIMGFYILKPFELKATTLDSGLSNWNLVDGSTASGNAAFHETLNVYFNNDADPDTNGKKAQYLYFGAATQNPNSGIEQGDLGLFTFLMEDLSGVNWDDYFAVDMPHIFVRWQEVGENGANSAKGYGDFTPVPEPRLIGAMALAGLGGFLVVRRRLVAKAKARQAAAS